MNIKNVYRGAPVAASISVMCALLYALTVIGARSLHDTVWGSALGSVTVLYGPFAQAEPWRVLTAGFMHLDATHLFVNVVMLALIGAEVERFIGARAFALAFGAGVIASSSAVLAFSYATPTVGASGALYTCMALLVAVASRRRADLRGPFALIAVNLAYSLLVPNVSLWGHLGGLAAGVLLAAPVTAPNTRTRTIAAGIGLVASVAVAVAVLYGA